MTVTPQYLLQMQLSGSSGAWTDVWGDVRLDSQFRGQYGIRGAGPLDRVAGVGTLTFALNNAPDNTAGSLGYYSPGHANARTGFEIGINVRFAVAIAGSTVVNTNGGFETGAGSAFTGWTTNTFDSLITVGSSSLGTGANVNGGTRSVGLRNSFDVGANVYVEQIIAASGGYDYALSFYTKGNNFESGRVAIYDLTNAADILPATDVGVRQASFAQVNLNFRVPTSCSSIRLRLIAPAAAGVGGFVYFDDVALYAPDIYYKFRGTLDEIIPVPGQRGRRLTLCTVVDWMDETRREKTRLIATQLDKRGNELIATTVANMVRKPAASALATGQDIFPFAFDNSPDERTSVMQMFQLIAQAELGFIYLAGDSQTGGVLTFQDRHARPTAGSAVLSLDDSMVAMTPRRSRDTIYNHIRASVHPRRTDASACVLFTLRSTPQVRAGCTLELGGAYLDRTAASNPLDSRIGAFTACNLVQNTDYLFNSASDGGGTNLTASLTVGASFGANAHRVTLANTGTTDGYVTRLQVRGRGLYDYEPVEMEAKDTDSTAQFGDNVLTYDMKLQNDLAVGRDVANYLLGVWKDPQTRIEGVDFVANSSLALMTAALQMEPSNRISLAEAVSGIDRDYYINGITFTLGVAGLLTFNWLVVPTDPFAAWIIGVAGSSEIGTTTIVGY